MPQSLANVLVHIVFSTRGRMPWLTPAIRADLFPYVGGVLGNLGCPALQIGGHDDHIHLLIRLSRTVTLAQAVEKVKTSTSKWLKTKGVADFAWQAGYGAFSVGPAEVPRVVRYIQTQEDRHGRTDFQDELRSLLGDAGMELDERYVWD